MLIFLDTEFTAFEEPYLISVGLVAADGQELYLELAGISPEICSPFVRENVLPFLTGPALMPIDLSLRIGAFLTPYNKRITFYCDAPRYDVELLRPFLSKNLRWNYEVPSFDSEDQYKVFKKTHEQAFISGLRRHHALADARALAIAWHRVNSDQNSSTQDCYRITPEQSGPNV